MKSQISNFKFRLPPGLWGTALFSVAILACWGFPRVWYVRGEKDAQFFWLAEQTNVAGWNYRPVPTSESAERILVADHLANGEFTRPSGDTIRVFAASRYREHENEVGLFAHTPDRCWTSVGWNLQPIAPDVVEVPVHGHLISFERRLFTNGGELELVYFGGLMGGHPLPYRLDHNLQIGLHPNRQAFLGRTIAMIRGRDGALWNWVWHCFSTRQDFYGPKQFVRISTPARGRDLPQLDAELTNFLTAWLVPVDYHADLASWESASR